MHDQTSPSVYDIECTDYNGKPLSLRQYTGRPLLIVNTASLCGFAYQLTELEALWQHYKNQGLVVIGIPSNDFGHQEPGNSHQAVTMCTAKFGLSFPLFGKIVVKGPQAHPLFQWLAKEGGFLSKPRWNYYKYLIGRDGHLKDWFSTITSPKSHRFELALENVIDPKTRQFP